MEENTVPPTPTPPVTTQQAPPATTTPPPNSMPKKKMSLGAIIGMILFFLIAGGAAAGFVYKDQIVKMVSKPEQIACTMEAKVCPDGSSVGRSGPKCEFAPCPTQAPDPTADWETYTDSRYHFAFQYRPFWRILVNPGKIDDDGNYSISIRSDLNHQQKDESIGDSVIIIVYPNPNHLKSFDYFKTIAFKDDLPGWNNSKQTTQILTIPTSDAIRIGGFMGGKGNFGPAAFISKDEIMIKMYAENSSKTNARIFDNMLSTFKFVTIPIQEQTQEVVDTSTWKTYIDTDYGFSMKYPSEVGIYARPPLDPRITKAEKEIGFGFDGTDAALIITVFKKDETQTLITWFNEKIFSAYPKETKIKEQLIKGLPGLLVSCECQGSPYYYIEDKNNVLEVRATIFKDEVINSLKFTD